MRAGFEVTEKGLEATIFRHLDAESAPPAGRQAQADEAERSISC
jgi:hypothetical protein